MLHRMLDNGLELVIKESHVSKMVAIQCWIGVGSLNERPDQYGMAHVLEHMLFKGTQKRGVGDISRQVEAYGGEINAFTTFDHTVYYLTLSSEYAFEGIDILSDAIFNSTFVEEELKREQEVILEEIRQAHDSPTQKLGRVVFERIYQGTAAARPIIGFEEQVARFSREDLIKFHREWYHPRNMRLIVVGDVDTRNIFPEIQEKFGHPSSQYIPEKYLPQLVELDDIEVKVIRGDYAQPRIEVAFPGPSLEDPDQVDLDLGAFALGCGDSSRLNRELRDNAGVASSVGCSLYAPAFGGLFGVSAIPEPNKILQCIHQIGEELKKLATTHPITEIELQRAVINLRADQLYQDETVGGIARSLGHSLATHHKTLYDDIYEVKVQKASCESVSNAVKKWIDLSKATIALVLSEDSPLCPEQIRDAFVAGSQGGSRQYDIFNTLPKKNDLAQQIAPTMTELLPGIKLVYRRIDEVNLFNMVAVTQGGLRGDRVPGLQNCFANLLGSANSRLGYDDLLNEVEGTGTILAGFSGKDSLGLKLQCFNERFHQISRTWAECLLDPVFPPRQWEITKLEILDELRSEQDSPANMAVRKFQEMLYQDHPYQYPIYGTNAVLEGHAASSLEQEFKVYRDQGSWVIGAVGSLDENEVKAHLLEILGEWKPKTEERKFHCPLKEFSHQKAGIAKDKEQTHVVMGFPGITWFDKDRYALDVLSTALGGSGGRLFIRLRDQESLAYTVSPMLTYGVAPGAFGAYIACTPEKIDQALISLEREFQLVCEQNISHEELDRAKNYLIGSHEAEMQRGDAQALTMALMEIYGVGFDDFLNYSKHIKRVNPADVKRVAQRIIDLAKMAVVTVGST